MVARETAVTPAAWIFDMDGVLVDTESIHREAYLHVFEQEGATGAAARLAALPRGLPREAVLTGVLGPLDAPRLARLMAAKQAAVERLVAVRGVATFAESLRCVHRVRTAGLGVAVATSSRAAHLFLGAACSLSVFDVIVQRPDVVMAKPAPDLFLHAADRLAVDVSRCVVVEDSPGGVAAGLAAGAYVIALTTTHTRQELADAHRIVADLTGLGPGL